MKLTTQQIYNQLLQSRLYDYENLVWLECGQNLMLPHDYSKRTREDLALVVSEMSMIFLNMPELETIDKLLKKSNFDDGDFYEVVKNFDKTAAMIINLARNNQYALNKFIEAKKMPEMPDTISEIVERIQGNRKELYNMVKRVKQ